MIQIGHPTQENDMSERVMNVWDWYILPLVQLHRFDSQARHGIIRNGQAIAWAMRFPNEEEECLIVFYWSTWNDDATCVMFCYCQNERGSSWEIKGCEHPSFPLGPSNSEDALKCITHAFELMDKAL